MMLFLGILLGGAIVVFLYESYFEKKENKIKNLLAPKLEELIEISSMHIAEKQREQNRNLTEVEKNEILDECYNRM